VLYTFFVFNGNLASDPQGHTLKSGYNELMNNDNPVYQQQLQTEADVWSKNAEDYYTAHKPDWHDLRNYNDYWVFARELEAFWNQIQPGDRVLELGCGAGWNALEMARRGAKVMALDIAEGALEIARKYYAQVRSTETLPGTIEFLAVDINHLESFAADYDWVVMFGTLHHAPDPAQLLQTSRRLLKPSGHLMIFDPLDTTAIHSLIIGFFFFVLPTHLSYGDKFRRLLAVRGQAVSRMTTSIEGRGLSPFEGVGRTETPRTIISQYFTLKYYHAGYSIRSFLSQELNVPRPVAHAILAIIMPFEWSLEQLHVLHGLRYIALGIPNPH
jgi:2-polyprenyl-3-methyl-5-hydroxy-6-metoxy-1,4-benzoquinol methylase